MTKQLKSEIYRVMSSGITNMFDLETVRYFAFRWGLNELSEFLEIKGNIRIYVNYILTGETETLSNDAPAALP